MVVIVRRGVVKIAPIPRDSPPVGSEYQLMVPALAAACKLTVPVPQMDPSVVPEMDGMALIVAVTAVLVDVVQPSFVASA